MIDAVDLAPETEPVARPRGPADEILEALKARASHSIWATELALSDLTRRCDFWEMEPHPSKGFRATAYEIKVSRADFKRDDAMKQREARLYSDQFYYVTPKGLLKPEEIPDWAGLLEWGGKHFRYAVRAPRRCKDAPSWAFIASLIRNCGEIRRDSAVVLQQMSALRAQNRALERRVEGYERSELSYFKRITALEAELKTLRGPTAS